MFILLSRGHYLRNRMIAVTRLNGTRLVVNAEQIRFIENTPDTMVTLMNGEKLMVKEDLQEVVKRALEYQRQIRAFGC